MHDPLNAPAQFHLPDNAKGCRERVAALHDEIASIRIQIATTDIRRQAEKRTLDSAWFHRAKTALRVKQQELAHVMLHLAGLSEAPKSVGRDAFKDALIGVVRQQCDDAQWADLVARARALNTMQDSAHG